MRTIDPAAPANEITSACMASEHRQARRASARRARSNEQLLQELLAEAHARIRALEEALERVKTAV